MNSRPDTWPGPDAVDEILSRERWEATSHHELAAIEWAVGDGDMLGEIVDRFAATDAYERAFAKWCEGQTP